MARYVDNQRAGASQSASVSMEAKRDAVVGYMRPGPMSMP